MLIIAAVIAAAASSAATPALDSNSPWWEKVTVTITADGKARACNYQSSFRTGDAADCEVTGSGSTGLGGGSATGQYTRITFERRFQPNAITSKDVEVSAGDTLLGGHVMNIAIDAAGTVKGCTVVARSGKLPPEYGCKEAAAERFQASASRSVAPRQGFMTVLVYGHQEHIASADSFRTPNEPYREKIA